MSLTYNYFCCIQIHHVLTMNNHDYFINRIKSSQVEHNHNARGVDRIDTSIASIREVSNIIFVFKNKKLE